VASAGADYPDLHLGWYSGSPGPGRLADPATTDEVDRLAQQ
jgi:hypothetical protein